MATLRSPSSPDPASAVHRWWPAAGAWAAGWLAMVALDDRLELANLAMLLVLASAVASLWLPAWASVLAGALGVLAFNWSFVPPRRAFSVELQQHVVLLGAMFAVNTIIGALVARQRRLAEDARRHAEREARLREWGDRLRDAADPAAHAGELQQALQQVSGVGVAVLVRTEAQVHDGDDASARLCVGEADADQQAGLALCIRQGQPLGPGSGRYEEQPDWYLPLRGRGATLGAAVLRGLGDGAEAPADLRPHAQALCDQLGVALQRTLAARQEQQARAEAHEQGLRNALLAAISHDYRTPLATIMSAASSLEQQAERLDAEQRRRLASGIVEEAGRLARLTDNTLQLVRLDAPDVALHRDWQSCEEIVGAVLGRVRRRDPKRRVRTRLEPGLPLVWCDAMLISQLLENLVDNALKYSPEDAPVELTVRRAEADVVLAVGDRGPGIAPASRERIFEVFRRGAEPLNGAATAQPAKGGVGVGLAACRAIARAHGGELRVRARGRGGSSFECTLPLREAPQAPQEAPA